MHGATLLLAGVLAAAGQDAETPKTRLYVRTIPPGAQIELDGERLGRSDGLFLVPPGVRKVTIEMDGYDPDAKTVTVRDGWITRVEVTLNKRPQPGPTAAAEGPPTALLSQEEKRLLGIWESLYREQREKNPWPAELRHSFLDRLFSLGPDDEMHWQYLKLYGDFAKHHARALCRIADVGGMVRWDQSEAARFGLNWTTLPTTLQVRLAQEDFWVYEALLRAIGNTNAGAKSHEDALIKQIDRIWIGRGADRRELGGPATGIPFWDAHDTVETDGRYVDLEGRALRHSDQPFAEFNMLPVDMRLHMDKEKIRVLLSRCANANMPLAVSEVTASAPRRSAASAGNEVKIWGIVRIFNLPDPAKLGTGTAGAEAAAAALKECAEGVTGPVAYDDDEDYERTDVSELQPPEKPKGRLDFRVAPTRAELGEAALRYISDLRANGPRPSRSGDGDYAWFGLRNDLSDDLITGIYEGRSYVLLSTKPAEVMLTPENGDLAWGLSRVYIDKDPVGNLAIGVRFDSAGSRRVAALTEATIDRRLAILVDDVVQACPTVKSRLADAALITGDFEEWEVKRLVEALEAGMVKRPASSTVPEGDDRVSSDPFQKDDPKPNGGNF